MANQDQDPKDTQLSSLYACYLMRQRAGAGARSENKSAGSPPEPEGPGQKQGPDDPR